MARLRLRPRLKSVTLRRFQSFVDEATIELPETGLLLLQGRNLDTGGSSGSGKSSINRAINYAFGSFPGAAGDLQSWGTQEPAVVKLSVCTDEGDLVISRGKKLDVAHNGAPVRGSVAQKEAAIERAVGLNADMLQALTYRGQRQPGLFLSKTDGDKKEFLTMLLGLDRFELALDHAQSAIRELEATHDRARTLRDHLKGALAEYAADPEPGELRARVAALNQKHASTTAAIADAQRSISAIRSQVAEDCARVQESFRLKLEEAEAAVAALVNAPPDTDVDLSEVTRLTAMSSQCELRIKRLEREEREQQGTVRVHAAALQSRLETLDRLIALVPRLEDRRQKALEECASLEASVCPTCTRPWEEARERAEVVKRTILAIEYDIQNGEYARAARPEVKAEYEVAQKALAPNPTIAKLHEMAAQARSQLAAEEAKVETFRKVAGTVRTTGIASARTAATWVAIDEENAKAAVRKQAESEIAQHESRKHETERELAAINQDLAEIKMALGKSESRAETSKRLTAELADADQALEEASKSLAAERDFHHLIGREGFLGSIFDEVLSEIGDEANQVLAGVANTRHCTIRFVSESLTLKGTVKKSILPVVSVGGHETPITISNGIPRCPGLSGGMLSTVELAVDLAVGAVISRRSGACPGWLILDETFDGLGPVEKESCLEILQKYGHERLVLVVDHMSETQGMFTSKILVEYREGESRIAI